MSNALRGIKRIMRPEKNKCCGRHMVEKEIPGEEVGENGEIIKVMRKVYVCEKCGRGRYLDGLGTRLFV